ncbi:MAG: MBL fold metallo-hydrolase [Methanotrichaceae archaeon]|nr:MBL fold metallo-hydrolase [Methanotrichaceae archaeon]
MSIKITLLGTGVGIPQPKRSQSSILIQNEMPLLCDCGSGTLLRLTEAGIGIREINTIILTHLHLDHTSDVMALANARCLLQLKELEVYGPVGTEMWIEKMHNAYPYLEKMQIPVQELRPNDSLYMKNLKITIEEAIHSVPALSFRIESDSSAVVYSGDTEPSSKIAEMARGADLLIHECSVPEPFNVTNHTTPLKLGGLIRDVNQVIFTHLYPETQGLEHKMALDFERVSGIPVDIGRDLQTIAI